MGCLDRNCPIVAERMRAAVLSHRSWGAFNAVSCAHNGVDRVKAHRTLKAAFRSLASMTGREKSYRRGTFAAAIVCPDGETLNWAEARAAIKGGAA